MDTQVIESGLSASITIRVCSRVPLLIPLYFLISGWHHGDGMAAISFLRLACATSLDLTCIGLVLGCIRPTPTLSAQAQELSP